MWVREHERYVRWDRIAIFSHAAALLVSLTIWRELILAAQFLAK